MREQEVNVVCKCGAELVITNFPVDYKDLTKKEVIQLSQYYMLKKCPKCDPKFTGEELEFELKRIEEFED